MIVKGKKPPTESESKGSSRLINNFYKPEVNYAMQRNRWLLKVLGLWPKSYVEKNWLERNVAHVLELLCIWLLAIVLVSCSLYTFLKETNPAIKVQLIGVISFIVMSIIKYGSLIRERQTIGHCINDLVADWTRLIDPEERKIMYDHALLVRHGTTLCTCFAWAALFFYVCILPILTGDIIIPDTNVTIRPLPLPVYFPLFNAQISPAYEIVFALQFCASFVMHSTAAASCSLAILFVMHSCGQLDIVNLWLKRLVDDDGDYLIDCNLDATLGIIIDQHVRTLGFISRTEQVLRNICLVELLGSTLNLCLLGFDLLMQWKHSDPIAMLTFAVLIVSFLFNIFSFCYIGEILTEKCQKVGEKTYMIDWYKLPSKTALGLTLTIATADRPITITAGKMTNLSLTTFFSVIKTAIGYFNILRTFAA
uniref:Odorant receptor n=1 Tax=Campoletis chlorideae TaxID=219166 RepID=A0A346D3X0_9HYME|nr:odorant receptor [Campoletis chlorideae]